MPPSDIVQPVAQRILIVRPSALGDVCRTVPVLAGLRRAYPDAIIDWVVRDAFADAIAAHPALDHAAARSAWRWFGDLRRRGYDLVLDCQGLGRSGLITWATRARARVGFRAAREFAWLGYNVRVAANGVHTVDAMLGLLQQLRVDVEPDMRLYTSPECRTWWTQRRTDAGFAGRPYAVLAPTARWLSKRWPIDRWRALIGPLRERGYERVVVIGAPGEEHQVAGVDAAADAPAVLNLVGATSVGQTMAAIEQASIVIANDSAPLHMAIGFDRPCVALFGPTDPALVGPYRRPEAIVRRFDPAPYGRVNYRAQRLGDALMREIRVEDVIERVDAVRHSTTPVRDGAEAMPVGSREEGP
jgi:ADP-heptose:LPS heptosyltransferase